MASWIKLRGRDGDVYFDPEIVSAVEQYNACWADKARVVRLIVGGEELFAYGTAGRVLAAILTACTDELEGTPKTIEIEPDQLD